MGTDMMGTPQDQIVTPNIPRKTKPLRSGRCLSCGTDQMRSNRRYCSKECRQHMTWVLSLSKGLLRTFNTRYAAFSFNQDCVILDVLPVWSKDISRFLCKRSEGRKPATDLKNLILQSGREWHQLVNGRNSGSFASFFLLRKNHQQDLHLQDIRPSQRSNPKLSRHEIHCLRVLNLDRHDLLSETLVSRVKGSYRKMAKIYHPDLGGDEEKFKHLNEAHHQMLQWAENPRFTARKALQGCWSYDGTANRWNPPL